MSKERLGWRSVPTCKAQGGKFVPGRNRVLMRSCALLFILERLAAGSKIYGGAFGSRVICVHAPRRLARRRAGRGRGQQADLRSACKALRLCVGALGSKLPHSRSTRAAQQLRSPTGRPRPVARKPSSRSERPAIEGLKIDSLSRCSKINVGVLGNRLQHLWWSVWKEVYLRSCATQARPTTGGPRSRPTG